MTLDRTVPKKNYIIKEIKGGMKLHRRLLDMGLTPGTQLFVAARAPYGGAVLIALRGIFIALRDTAAEIITVDYLREATANV